MLHNELAIFAGRFFFNDTATTEIYTYGHTLSLHGALPISYGRTSVLPRFRAEEFVADVGCAIDDLRHLIESRRDIDHLTHRGALAVYPRRVTARGYLGVRPTVDLRNRAVDRPTGTFRRESSTELEVSTNKRRISPYKNKSNQ